MLTTTSIALSGKVFFVIAKKKNGNLFYLTNLGAWESNIEKAERQINNSFPYDDEERERKKKDLLDSLLDMQQRQTVS